MTAPHLAAALAFISKNKELLADGSATVYLMPSEIMVGSDTQAPSPAKDSVHSLLERLDEPPSNDATAVPIVYEIAVEAERGSSAATLRIHMLTNTGQSLASLLEVNLAKSGGKWKGIGWQAR
jgi:hypothetical protein